jgi:transcriptional regulator with XRE-family HTH domain
MLRDTFCDQLCEPTMVDPVTVSNDQLAGIRQRLGLTQADFARLVGLSERTIAGWETGAELKPNSLRRIIEIERLSVELAKDFYSTSELSTWFTSANTGFDGSSPLDVIERGEIDKIWHVLYYLQSGSPN